jgi:hypothetical protein
MRDCLAQLSSIARRFIANTAERVADSLLEVDGGKDPAKLQTLSRELSLSADLTQAIGVLATILNGYVVSNQVERRLGEENIGVCVTLLLSLMEKKELCTLGSTAESPNGETKDHSLGSLLRRHSDELSRLVLETPFSPSALPQRPSIKSTTFD